MLAGSLIRRRQVCARRGFADCSNALHCVWYRKTRQCNAIHAWMTGRYQNHKFYAHMHVQEGGFCKSQDFSLPPASRQQPAASSQQSAADRNMHPSKRPAIPGPVGLFNPGGKNCFIAVVIQALAHLQLGILDRLHSQCHAEDPVAISDCFQCSTQRLVQKVITGRLCMTVCMDEFTEMVRKGVVWLWACLSRIHRGL